MSSAAVQPPPAGNPQQQQQQQQPSQIQQTKKPTSTTTGFIRPSVFPTAPPTHSLLTSGAALQGNNHGGHGHPYPHPHPHPHAHAHGFANAHAYGPTYGASPMSFGMAGMSFTRPSQFLGETGGGVGGESWKGSLHMNMGMGMGMSMMGTTPGGGGGFASFSGREMLAGMGMGGMGLRDRGDRDEPMMDPFLSSPGNDMAYSFTGKNGSYRSSPYGNPMMLGQTGNGSFRGGSFMGSLNAGGQSWVKFRKGEAKKEAEFCKDFICCGKDLGNLHDLLEHYEEAHVVVLGSPGSPRGMELSMAMDMDDVEMDSLDEASPGSSSASGTSNSTNVSPVPGHALPGLLPTSNNGTAMSSAMKQLLLDDILAPQPKPDSAFDSYIVSSPPKIFTGPSATLPGGRKASLTLSRRAFVGGFNDPGATPKSKGQDFTSAFGTNVRKKSPTLGFTPEEPAKNNQRPAAVSPNVLYAPQNDVQHHDASANHDEGQDGSDDVGGAGGAGGAVGAGAGAGAGAGGPTGSSSSKTAAAENTQPSLFATHRPYRCPQPGCQKAYKQSNGLKYHLLKGQCNFEVRDAMELGGLTLEEAEELAKPYLCAAGQGCKKRYRQMNGLKYHYMNSGPHGEIGLLLLSQGKHPHPPNVPTPEKPKNANKANQNATADADVRPGNWMRNAVKASGKDLGLPLENGSMHRGEDAVLFSSQPGFD